MQAGQSGRRTFLTLLAGAAVGSPLAARAQQPAKPVIGFIGSQAPDAISDYVRALRQSLKDSGFIEGETVAIEYRWAHNQVERCSPDARPSAPWRTAR